MNKVHKSVWSAAVGTFVAAAETTRARGKKSRSAVQASAADNGEADGVLDPSAAPGPIEAASRGARMSKVAVMALAMGAGAVLTPSVSMADGASVKIGDGAVTDSNNGTGNSYVLDPVTGTKTNLGMIDNLVAIGAGATATFAKNVAIGGNARAINGAEEGGYNTAIGDSALAQGDGSIRELTSPGQGFTTAIGGQSQALHDNTTAVGASALANVKGATAVGMKAAATSDQALAVGNYSSAAGAGSIALGATSHSTGASSVALGYTALSGGSNSIALGTKASALMSNSVALGAGSVAARNDSVSVGTSGSERQITNVAAGSAGTDAVNLNQLNAAIASVGGDIPVTDAVQYDSAAHTRVSLGGAGSGASVTLSNVAGGIANTDAVNVKQLKDAGLSIDTSGNVTSAFVAYDDASKSKVTLGGSGSPGAVALTNVAAGQVTSASKDAVNGSQLYGTASTAASALGGGTSVGTDGKLSKPAYALNGSTYNDVGTALAAVNAKAASGLADSVMYDTTAHHKVTFGGVGGTTPVTLANVAGGIVNTDAVNVKQLKDAGLSIDTSGNVTSAFVAYDDTSKSKVTLGGSGSSAAVALTNVAAGQVTSTSKDAVNGSQLYGTASTAASALGGATSVGTDGKLSKPAYALNGSTYNDVGTALAAVNAKAASGLADSVMYDTTAHHKVTFGGVGGTTPVTLANVAGGIVNTDAVNVKQLKDAGLSIDTSGNVTSAFVAYDDTSKSKVTLGGVGSSTAVALTNVAAGQVTSTSKDAVNGSQLYNTASTTASALGGGTAVGTDGKLSKPAYTLNGSTYNDVGTALAAVNAKAASGATDGVVYDTTAHSKVTFGGVDAKTPVTLANVAGGIVNTDAVNVKQLKDAGLSIDTSGNVTSAFVAYDDTSKSKVTLGGVGSSAAAALTNVAAGRVASTSKDAINGSQLYNTASTVASALGGGTAVGSDGGLSKPAYSVSGNTYNDVGSALGAMGTAIDGINGTITNTTKYIKVVSNSSAALASGGEAVAIGGGSFANATNAVAIGAGARAMYANSMALGSNSLTTEANTLSVGAKGGERRIVNVADGQVATDVATFGQLSALQNQVNQKANVVRSTLMVGAATTPNYVVVSPNTTAGASTTTDTSLDAMAVGPGATGMGEGSVAIGAGAGTVFGGSTAVGSKAGALAVNTTVVGAGATTTNYATNAVAIGYNANVQNKDALAIGSSSLANATSSIAMGSSAFVTTASANSMALGAGATSSSSNSVALGANSVADRTNAVSVGSSTAQRQIVNVSRGTMANDAVNVSQLKGVTTAIGGGAAVNSDGSINMPSFTVAGQTYTDVGSALGAITSSGLGADAVKYDSSTRNKVTLGGTSATSPVTLTNVASGIANADAVNVKQLKDLGASFDTSGNVAGGFVAYDDSTKNAITLKGASGTTKISGLTAGSLSTSSTDAVNGTQLFQTNQNVANVAGDVTNLTDVVNNITNIGAGIKYFHANSTLADSSATGTDAVAIGGNAKATANNSVAVGANAVANRANSVSVGASGAERQIINVAAGNVDTDAVNVKQLKDLGASFDTSGNVTGGFVAYDNATKSKVTLGGTGSTSPVTLTNVAAGIANVDAVNVKQLKDLGASFDTSGNVTGGFVAYDNATKSKVTLGGAGSTSPVTLTNVAAGIANVDAVNVKQLKDLGASFDTSGNVTGGFVAYDNAAKSKVTLGGAGSTSPVTLTNVAAGIANVDAVNVKQLKDLGASFDTSGNVTGGFVAYDNEAKSKVTLGGAGSTSPVTLTNVAAGIANVDAVNVKQLKDLGASFDTSGNVTGGFVAYDNAAKSKVTLGGAGSTSPVTLTNVAAGIANVDAVNVKQLKDLGASFDTSGNVTGGFVAYDDSTKNAITLKGASGTTKISGLTAGALSTSSTDAVNGTQLFQTNQNVANVAGNVTNLTDVVNNITNIGTGIKYFHANSTLADSSATGTDAVAIGGNAKATANNSVALGANATTTANLNAAAYQLASGTLAGTVPVGEVSVGSAGKERRVTNVAAGSVGTDAVNVSQLQAAVTSGSSAATADVVKYDTSAHDKVTLGGANPGMPVALTNLAAGTISTNSRDAVTGAQIYGVSASVADALGGGASVSTNGTVTRPAYALGTQTYTDVGSALQGISSTVDSIDNTITMTTKYIKVVSEAGAALASGSEAVAIGGGSFANAKNSVAIGAGARSGYADSLALGTNSTTTVANTVSVGSKGNERRIMNVADGTAPSDAATVAQLSALQAMITPKPELLRSTLAVGAASSDVTQWIAVSSQTTGGLTTSASDGENAMAFGPGAAAMGDSSLALGASSATVHDNSTAVGARAGALSVNTTVIGAGATTNTAADNSVAIGYNSAAQAKDSLALGSATVTNAANSVAMGNGAYVLGAGTASMALGSGATASAANAVALGANSMADRADAVSVGSSTAKRQIINLAAGSADTDAVNVQQLNNAIKAVSGGGSADAVIYDTSAHTSLTLGGAGSVTPVTLTNVAAGAIAAGSKDAVNGGQLYDTASSVADALGGGSKAGTDGKVSKPAYAVDGNTFNDVGAALAAVDAKASTGSANGVVYDTSAHDKLTLGGSSTAAPVTVTNLAAGVGNTDAVNVKQLKDLGASFDSSGHVTGAFVAYDDASKGKVTFGGAGVSTPVLLTNVGGGQVASGSTDAINGSQLFNTASSVAAAIGGNSKAGADGKISAPAYTLDGNTFNDVGAALAAVDAKAASGSVNGVVYDTSVHDKLTLGGSSTNKPVVLTNVAAAKDDSDAVNLKQLKDAGISIDTSGNVTSAFVAYDNLNKGSVTFNPGSTPTQLKNVANGTDLFDAVNVGQMEAYVAKSGGGGTANAVAYDDSNRNVVTLGGAGHAPVTLTNVAAGANASDAINYSQFTTLESKVNNLSTGGGSSTYININSAADATPAAASGTDAIAIGNGASANGKAAIAIGARTTTAGDNSVSLGVGSSAPATNAVALGANAIADRDNSVSVGIGGGERQITNVAAGTQATDAVNLGQLNNAMGGVQQQMHDIDRNAGKGIAAASALNIVTPYLPGRTTLNAGVANYRGYQAVGLGVSRWNEKGTINYNLGVSTSGGNSTIVRAGIGIVLGN